MYVEHALVVSDDSTVAVLLAALDQLDDDTPVVVQRNGPGGEHYVFDAASLHAMLGDWHAEDEIEDALGIDAFFPARVVPPEGGFASPGDVVLFDSGSAGVVTIEDSGVRGAGAGPLPLPSPGDAGPAAAIPPPMAGGVTREDSTGDAVCAALTATGGHGEESVRFRAFPGVGGPAAAVVGTRFTVTVGFAQEPPGDDEAEPVIVADAPKWMTFGVQLTGFGLSFPEGVRRDLVVDRDAPEQSEVSFEVEAGPVRRAATRTVEASFEYDGELVGTAWLDVRVTSPEHVAGQPERTSDQPEHVATRGGSSVQLGDGSSTPDLTVEIRGQDATFEWVFHPRHDVPRPEDRVWSRVAAASGEAFAAQLTARLSVVKGADSLPEVVRGMGRFVADAIPVEFWDILAATWAAVGPDATPTLLITTNEPFVPWELAWVEPDVVDPALLPTGVTEAPLGSLWNIGRWVPPRRLPRNRTGRPASPPERGIDVRTLGVVVGDYSEEKTVRNLPFAIEEGKQLVAAASALSLVTTSVKATDAEVDRILNPGTGVGDPPACDAVHIAAHGQVSLRTPEHTGILLAGGRRLDLFAVRGSTIGAVSRPLIFLNACQVGTAGRVLSTYGGLAGAFLASGCRAFLAPLWNVDDDVARDVAVEFYRLTLEEGQAAGEAMRRIRQGFARDGESATPLAYVFYGHPELHLRPTGTDDEEGD